MFLHHNPVTSRLLILIRLAGQCLCQICPISKPAVVRETPSCLYEPSGCIWCAVIGRFPVVKKLLISGPGLPRPISARLLSSVGRLNVPGPRPLIYRVLQMMWVKIIQETLEFYSRMEKSVLFVAVWSLFRYPRLTEAILAFIPRACLIIFL